MSQPTNPNYFQAQLERILASLKASKGHASGTKKPSLGQQEASDK